MFYCSPGEVTGRNRGPLAGSVMQTLTIYTTCFKKYGFAYVYSVFVCLLSISMLLFWVLSSTADEKQKKSLRHTCKKINLMRKEKVLSSTEEEKQK